MKQNVLNIILNFGILLRFKKNLMKIYLIILLSLFSIIVNAQDLSDR